MAQNAYAPFQAWVTNALVRDPTNRGPSQMTDYDPVFTGNVIPGEIPVGDPGSVGQGNLPNLHTARDISDPHLNPSLPSTDSLSGAIPRAMRWIGLRGGNYQAYTFTDVDNYTNEFTPAVAIGQQPFGMTGGTSFAGDIDEHGPISSTELGSTKGVRQPVIKKRTLIEKLLFLPNKHADQTGARDERTLPATGEEDKGKERLSDAAVATGNTFTIPDVRRTWDNPADAEPYYPKDETGTVVFPKAGFPLTPTPLEGSPHDVQTSHAYPNFLALTETPIGDSGAGRIRAGVQFDLQSNRTARQPHWYDFRPFDQVIAHHPLALKGMLKQPIASRPLMTNDDPQANLKWAAGRRFSMPAAGMTAFGITPNIDRQPPQAWDTNVYLEDNSGTVHDGRASGWRLT